MIGIYMISNRINGKKYIGQSKDIIKRFGQHMKRKSKNIYIQKDKECFGIESFELSILEICKEEELEEKERYYCQKINPEYNITKNFKRPCISKETKNKMSISAKKRMEKYDINKFINSENNNRYKKRKILSINIETKEEIIHESLYSAQKYTEVPRSSIHQIINGKRKQSKGFLFKYID